MELNMKENGKMVKLVDKESFSILMEMYMRGNGQIIKQMATVYTQIRKVQDMKATGKMISNMDRELKHGMRAQSTRVSMLWERKRDSVNTLGQTVQYTRVNG
jgi:hypothetical protein